jgi:hypothetical protein
MHPDARRAMAGGADGAADALIQALRQGGSVRPAGTYRVPSVGMRSADDYLRLPATCRRGRVVAKRITPAHADRRTCWNSTSNWLTGIAGFAERDAAECCPPCRRWRQRSRAEANGEYRSPPERTDTCIPERPGHHRTFYRRCAVVRWLAVA